MPSTVMSESFPRIYSQMSSPVRAPTSFSLSSEATIGIRERTSTLRDFMREHAQAYVERAIAAVYGRLDVRQIGVFSEVNVRWSSRNFYEMMYSPLSYMADTLQGPTTVQTSERLRSLSARYDAALRSIILHDWSSPAAVQGDTLCSVGEALGEGVTLCLSDEISQINPLALPWLTEMWRMNVESHSALFHAAHDPMNFLYFLRPGRELENSLRRVPRPVWATVSQELTSQRNDRARAIRSVVGVDLASTPDRSGLVIRDRHGNDIMSMGVLSDSVVVNSFITAEMISRNTIQPFRVDAAPAPDHPDAGKVLLRPMRTVFGVSVESVREKDGTVATRKTTDTRK